MEKVVYSCFGIFHQTQAKPNICQNWIVCTLVGYEPLATSEKKNFLASINQLVPEYTLSVIIAGDKCKQSLQNVYRVCYQS